MRCDNVRERIFFFFVLVSITHHSGSRKGCPQSWIWCSRTSQLKFRPRLRCHPQTSALLLDSPPTRCHSLGTLPVHGREKKYFTKAIQTYILGHFINHLYSILLQKHSVCQCTRWLTGFFSPQRYSHAKVRKQ